MKGKRVFVPQKRKMSPEYEAQIKHFFEVTQKKLIAKYGANVNLRGEPPTQIFRKNPSSKESLNLRKLSNPAGFLPKCKKT